MGLLLNLVWYEAKKKRKNKTWQDKNNSAILDAICIVNLHITHCCCFLFLFLFFTWPL